MKEDPAAVAARAETERTTAVGLGVVLAIIALGAALNFVRDTKQAVAELHRPKKPWGEW